MKRFTTLLLCAASSVLLSAQTTDTIALVKDARHVLITQKDSVIDINIFGTSQDPNYHLRQRISTSGDSFVEAAARKWDFSIPSIPLGKKKKNRAIEMSVTFPPALQIGLSHPQSSQFPARWESNWDIDLQIMSIRLKWDKHPQHLLALNLGYGWGKYVMDTPYYLQHNKGVVSVGDYPTGTQPGRSVARFNRWYYQLGYRYRFDSGIRLWAAVQLNSHIRPRLYNTYYKNENKHEVTHKDNIRLRPLTMSYLAGITQGAWGVYVKYNPKSAFEEGYGPQSSTLTLGLSLNVF